MDTDKYGGIRDERELNTGTSVVRINLQEGETSKIRRDVKANLRWFPSRTRKDYVSIERPT